MDGYFQLCWSVLVKLQVCRCMAALPSSDNSPVTYLVCELYVSRMSKSRFDMCK